LKQNNPRKEVGSGASNKKKHWAFWGGGVTKVKDYWVIQALGRIEACCRRREALRGEVQTEAPKWGTGGPE